MKIILTVTTMKYGNKDDLFDIAISYVEYTRPFVWKLSIRFFCTYIYKTKRNASPYFIFNSQCLQMH